MFYAYFLIQVLTLSGVSRVFHSRFQLLTTVGDFNRSWTALLDYITDFALRRSHEVSLVNERDSKYLMFNPKQNKTETLNPVINWLGKIVYKLLLEKSLFILGITLWTPDNFLKASTGTEVQNAMTLFRNLIKNVMGYLAGAF